MNILLISALAPPVNSPEAIQAGRYMSRLVDHRITLVTAKVKNAWEPRDDTLPQGKLSQRIERTLLPGVIQSGIQRLKREGMFPDAYALFARGVDRVWKEIQERPDVILSRSTPASSAVLAREAMYYFGVPWIMHLSDPLADNIFFKYSAKRESRLNELESRCFGSASLVTLTSNQTVAFYQAKYPELQEKFRWLPNVMADDDVNDQPVDFSIPMKIVFTGRLYGFRRIHEWVDAIEATASKFPGISNRIQFEVVGNLDKESEERIRNTRAVNLQYLGPKDYAETRRIQRTATLLVAIDGFTDDRRADLFFPSKLLDYMAARRKIIALTAATSSTHGVIHGRNGWCFDKPELSRLPEFFSKALAAYENRDAAFFEASVDQQYLASTQGRRLEEFMLEVTRR